MFNNLLIKGFQNEFVDHSFIMRLTSREAWRHEIGTLYLQCMYVEHLKVSKINHKYKKSNIKIYVKFEIMKSNRLKKLSHTYENANLL